MVTLSPPCSTTFSPYLPSSCCLIQNTKCGAFKVPDWVAIGTADKVAVMVFSSSAVMYPSSLILLATSLALSTYNVPVKGEYLEGDCGRPARIMASGRVKSETLFWKYWVAASPTPQAVPP